MRLRVTLTGSVGLEVDGTAVDDRLGRPGRVALAYLASERHRPVPRDELADVVWGEQLPASWQQMLRGLVHKLRTTFQQAGLDPAVALATGSGTYRLLLPPDATVDVEDASAFLAAAEGAFEAGYLGTAETEASAAAAIAARGFAPGVSGAWVEGRQAELRELHLRALEVTARSALADSRWSDAVAAAEQAVALEPFRESAYLSLMDAHAAAGNPGEALRAYERCRYALAEDLGVSPSAPTEAAYLQLLAGTVAAPASAVGLPLPLALVALPGSLVVGRSAEVELLTSAFKRVSVEGRRGVLVAGEPGVGKTTVVAEFARDAHAEGARVLYGCCDDEIGAAYQPFAEALSGYVATCPLAELRAHVAAWGGEAGRLVPGLARRLPEFSAPPPTEADADRWRLFRPWTTCSSAPPPPLRWWWCSTTCTGHPIRRSCCCGTCSPGPDRARFS